MKHPSLFRVSMTGRTRTLWAGFALSIYHQTTPAPYGVKSRACARVRGFSQALGRLGAGFEPGKGPPGAWGNEGSSDPVFRVDSGVKSH